MRINGKDTILTETSNSFKEALQECLPSFRNLCASLSLRLSLIARYAPSLQG